MSILQFYLKIHKNEQLIKLGVSNVRSLKMDYRKNANSGLGFVSFHGNLKDDRTSLWSIHSYFVYQIEFKRIIAEY